METISGVSNWQLVVRREAAGVTILYARTCDERAALPEELFGLPVIALGPRALAGNRTAPAGRRSSSPAAVRERSGTTHSSGS